MISVCQNPEGCEHTHAHEHINYNPCNQICLFTWKYKTKKQKSIIAFKWIEIAYRDALHVIQLIESIDHHHWYKNHAKWNGDDGGDVIHCNHTAITI